MCPIVKLVFSSLTGKDKLMNVCARYQYGAEFPCGVGEASLELCGLGAIFLLINLLPVV